VLEEDSEPPLTTEARSPSRGGNDTSLGSDLDLDESAASAGGDDEPERAAKHPLSAEVAGGGEGAIVVASSCSDSALLITPGVDAAEDVA